MNFNVYISPDLLVSSALDKMVLSRHFEVYSTRFPPRRGVVMSMLVLDSSWRENMARGCVRFFWTLPVVALPGVKNTSYHDFYGNFIWLRFFVGIAVEGVMTGIKYARGVQSSLWIAPGTDAEILGSVLTWKWFDQELTVIFLRRVVPFLFLLNHN